MTATEQIRRLQSRIQQLRAEVAYWQSIATDRQGVIEQLRRKVPEPRFGKVGVKPGILPWHDRKPRRKP